MAELADAPDLGSGGATRGGSSPPFRTSHLGPILQGRSGVGPLLLVRFAGSCQPACRLGVRNHQGAS